ncbi:MAG TPA: hypothetical protein VFT13_02715 [Candidatus Krumholzibacteria bacterium]|nr:hypothetical protein [Candidatus Krumholzibacteria bacterium]
MRRIIGAVALVATMTSVVATAYPVRAGNAGDDLKHIEYRYYFRGRYQQAIEALQTFLARVDLTPVETLRAREVLAASYVLGGAPAMGREVFAQLIVADPAYAGPDPTIFKLEVVNAYGEARSEYAARTLKSVPAQDPLLPGGDDDDAVLTAVETPGKPIYKKWWFYAGATALLLGVGAAVSGGDDPAAAPAAGSVVVGVRIQ